MDEKLHASNLTVVEIYCYLSPNNCTEAMSPVPAGIHIHRLKIGSFDAINGRACVVFTKGNFESTNLLEFQNILKTHNLPVEEIRLGTVGSEDTASLVFVHRLPS
jgi:hypothetical protein